MSIIQNQRQGRYTLNELSKRKVVEHNSLITSIAKMDKTPLKMFELAISLIDTENPRRSDGLFIKARVVCFFKLMIATSIVVLKPLKNAETSFFRLRRTR